MIEPPAKLFTVPVLLPPPNPRPIAQFLRHGERSLVVERCDAAIRGQVRPAIDGQISTISNRIGQFPCHNQDTTQERRKTQSPEYRRLWYGVTESSWQRRPYEEYK